MPKNRDAFAEAIEHFRAALYEAATAMFYRALTQEIEKRVGNGAVIMLPPTKGGRIKLPKVKLTGSIKKPTAKRTKKVIKGTTKPMSELLQECLESSPKTLDELAAGFPQVSRSVMRSILARLRVRQTVGKNDGGLWYLTGRGPGDNHNGHRLS